MGHPAKPRIRPTFKPCLANDRHQSTLHVAVCVPGYVEVCGCGLQVRKLVTPEPQHVWCDECRQVLHGMRKPQSNHMDDCRSDGGRKSRMAAEAARQRREGTGKTPDDMDELADLTDWDGE